MSDSDRSFSRRADANVPWYSFVDLSSEADATAAISTRHGGVSEGGCSSLNLSYAAEADQERVTENRRRFFAALSLSPAKIVTAQLAHGTRVVYVDESHAGEGPICPPGEADGLITDRPGLGLFLCVADCVPLLAVDPIRGRIGLAHAGWRGTLGGIAAELIRALSDQLGSNPADLRLGIGPSIGPCCYGVGPEVHLAFAARWPFAAEICGQRQDHWWLDLREANRQQLIDAGVSPNQITVAGVCTSCQVRDFFSHRAQKGKAGRFGAVVALPNNRGGRGGGSGSGGVRPRGADRASPRENRPGG